MNRAMTGGLSLLLLTLSVASCTSSARSTLGTITLDPKDPKAEAYFNQVSEKIRSKWTYPRQAGEKGIEGESQIEFHIAKSGRLEFIALRKSSGLAVLDDYAMVAVKLAQPFPPLPDYIANQTLKINGIFRYQLPKN